MGFYVDVQFPSVLPLGDNILSRLLLRDNFDVFKIYRVLRRHQAQILVHNRIGAGKPSIPYVSFFPMLFSLSVYSSYNTVDGSQYFQESCLGIRRYRHLHQVVAQPSGLFLACKRNSNSNKEYPAEGKLQLENIPR